MYPVFNPGQLDPVQQVANVVGGPPAGLEVQLNQPMGAGNTSSNVPTTSTPISSGGGGYSAPANPNAQYIPKVQEMGGRLNDIYNQIFGQLPQDVERQRQNLQGQYQNLTDTLNNQYMDSTRKLPWMFAAKGTAGSTDYGDAVNTANQSYQGGLGQINSDQNSKLQALAAFGDSNANKYHEGQKNLNMILGDNSLINPYTPSNLEASLLDATGFLGNLGSSGKFYNDLQQFSPDMKNDAMGTQSLSGQLSSIAKSTVPQFAKDQIAQGTIGSNQKLDPNSQGYWMNYYNNLTG